MRALPVEGAAMISAVRERCAGLDVHRDFVMVCVMWGAAQAEAQWEMHRFGTTVPELQQMKEWLAEQGCGEVVLESTGPYWEPIFNILEGAVKVCLANPQEVKNRRGHKTDKKDAWWLAHLFRHGMIRASYLPEPSVRELRMLTRQRREKIRAVAQEKNRPQKVLGSKATSSCAGWSRICSGPPARRSWGPCFWNHKPSRRS